MYSGLGSETGKHTDLLIMAKQLGNQGSLSKNLEEREGTVYRRAGPSLGYSGLFPTLYGFCLEVLLGFPEGGKLTSRAGVIGGMLSALFLTPRGLYLPLLLGRQPRQKHCPGQYGTLGPPMQLKTFSLLGVKFWGKGQPEILGWKKNSG